MFPQATDGSQSNNELFSMCSIDSIRPVLETKGSCFSGKYMRFDMMWLSRCVCIFQPVKHFVEMGLLREKRNLVIVGPCVMKTYAVMAPHVN